MESFSMSAIEVIDSINAVMDEYENDGIYNNLRSIEQ